jgi:hypothetical protein
MSYILDSLPKFRRIPTAEAVQQSALLPNAVIVAEDTEQLFIDTDEKRIDLSPVRHVKSKEQLPEAGGSAVYLTDAGMLYIYAGGIWHEFTPSPMSEAVYMYRFEVLDDFVEELRFNKDSLGVSHSPEFDIVDTTGTNITNSDFITRQWAGNEYIISYSGGWPKGEYFLKLSYNVKYDSQGIYITDKTSTTPAIKVAAGEHYVFEEPLTSLSVDLVDGCKGEGSVWFTTGDSFIIDFPDTIRFFGGRPAFNTNTEYVLTVRNGAVAVGIVSN